MTEQFLLWIPLAFVIALGFARRKRPGLLWSGMGFAIIGILVLAACSIHERSWLSANPEVMEHLAKQPAIWRMLELIGLALAGVGVILMSVIADSERRNRRLEAEVLRVAPHLHGSGKVLLEVLGSATDAGLVLRVLGPSDGGPRVLLADDTARRLLDIPSGDDVPLSKCKNSSLVDEVQRRSREASRVGGMSRGECDDEGKWFSVSAGRHGDAIIVLLEDITERKRAQLALSRAAYTDPLTGLANRKFFDEQIGDCVEIAKQDPSAVCVVLCFDLDEFKEVNDQHGHHVGDELLVRVGARVTEALGEIPARIGAGHLAVRWGGDEFVIVLQLDDITDATAFAERLHGSLAVSHEIEGLQVRSTVSMGGAVVTAAHTSTSAVLRDADAAMYVAKKQGRNRLHLLWQEPGEVIAFPESNDRRQRRRSA